MAHILQQFPAVRARRRRRTASLRSLSQENHLRADQLILPLFVHDQDTDQTIASMPGVARQTIQSIVATCKQAVDAGIQAVALFPVIPAELKDPFGSEAINPTGLVPRVLEATRQACPELSIITDIALDPYTSHGQDGVLDDFGDIANDATVEILCQQALCHAQAGAAVVAPSDMMDGRIGSIRSALESANHSAVAILAYTAKYASSFYGPFRDAVGSAAQLGTGDKMTYQMNPANGREALIETALDVAEGADFLMVKPAMPYLDVISRMRAATDIPVFAYQVSGEYSMLKLAIEHGLLPPKAIFEALIACKRAGADAILTYSALEVALQL